MSQSGGREPRDRNGMSLSCHCLPYFKPDLDEPNSIRLVRHTFYGKDDATLEGEQVICAWPDR